MQQRDNAPLSIPPEVWILADQLSRYGLAEENLFFTPGDTLQMEAIRAALDRRQLPPQGLVAHVLLLTDGARQARTCTPWRRRSSSS